MKKIIFLILLLGLAGIFICKTKGPQFSKRKIFLGIVPHDTSASFIIADFFQRLSVENSSVVILVGPNHFERGDFKVLSGVSSWQTSFGNVEAEKNIIENLKKQGLLKIDEETLRGEHSIGALMPFFKFYLPKALVVPIILSNHLSIEEINVLANKLESYVRAGIPLVVSLDFSHYLRNKEAQEKDELTLKLIKNFDYYNIIQLKSDYLDSPPSLILLLMLAQRLSKNNFEIFYHTNSGEVLRMDHIPTTSWFSGVFR